MGSGSNTRMNDIDWRFATYVLVLPILLFYCITVTGSLPGLKNIYLVQLSATGKEALRVRVGYFGMCVGSQDSYTCVPRGRYTPDTLASRLNALGRANLATLGTTHVGSLHSLLTLAFGIQAQLLCLLAPAGLLFCFSITSLLLAKRSFKKVGNIQATKRRMQLRRATLSLTWISVAMTISAATAVTMSTSVLQFTTRSDASAAVEVTAGITLQAFQWVIVSLSFLYAVGIAAIFRAADISAQHAGYGQYKGAVQQSGLPPPPPPPPPPPGY